MPHNFGEYLIFAGLLIGLCSIPLMLIFRNTPFRTVGGAFVGITGLIIAMIGVGVAYA